MVTTNYALSSWEREPQNSVALFYNWPAYDFKIHPESYDHWPLHTWGLFTQRYRRLKVNGLKWSDDSRIVGIM